MGVSLPKSNLIFKKKCLDKWVHFRQGVTENVYTHYELESLREAINKI